MAKRSGWSNGLRMIKSPYVSNGINRGAHYCAPLEYWRAARQGAVLLVDSSLAAELIQMRSALDAKHRAHWVEHSAGAPRAKRNADTKRSRGQRPVRSLERGRVHSSPIG